MQAKNLLFILSDEHTREITGCYGNDIVQTPHLDRLAEHGVCFDNAYTPCPICVPARASLATGRWVHQTGHWDNAHAYYGDPPGWGHRLLAENHRVTAIGKLHYRGSGEPSGWSEEIDTLHIVDGVGDVFGCNRRDIVERPAVKNLALEAGPGDSSYIQYDKRITEQACRWLRHDATRYLDKPWVLFVGFVLPHFPLIAPPEFYDLYARAQLPPPRLYAQRPDHPVLQRLARAMAYDDYFDEQRVRIARQAYFAMVSFLDHNIGRVLNALREAGLADDTRVIYTTDHGDNIGHRGLWGKSVMYEEAAALPMIMAGPGIAQGQRVATPVSLVDVYPTVVEGAGLGLSYAERHDLPGHSLYRTANGEAAERTILSEYHAAGSITAMFMIRNDRYKYVHYVGYPPQLFDLQADPHETRDLGQQPVYRSVVADCEAKLRAVCDPDAVNRRAFRDQQARIDACGGWQAVKQRGDFGYTPAPGQTPEFAGSTP